MHSFTIVISYTVPSRPQTIQKNHPNTEECFAAFLHEYLKCNEDPNLMGLLESLRSVSVGRTDVANDLEEMIKAEQLGNH